MRQYYVPNKVIHSEYYLLPFLFITSLLAMKLNSNMGKTVLTTFLVSLNPSNLRAKFEPYIHLYMSIQLYSQQYFAAIYNTIRTQNKSISWVRKWRHIWWTKAQYMWLRKPKYSGTNQFHYRNCWLEQCNST